MYLSNNIMNKICVVLVIVSVFGNGIARKPRIVGGERANIEDFPYQVSMRMSYDESRPRHFCGGSIVSEIHIVTAAHCVRDKRLPSDLRLIKVYSGTSRSDYGGKAHSIESITVHPWFTDTYTKHAVLENDIAIVTLKEPIIFDELQQPIKLPSKNVQTGRRAMVSGWGNLYNLYGNTPIHLHKVSMKLLTSYDCKKHIPHPLKSSQVCALQSAGVGICSGDSGSPLTVDGELVGIASFVVDCAKGYPDVFTNVYPFIDFIEEVIDY